MKSSSLCDWLWFLSCAERSQEERLVHARTHPVVISLMNKDSDDGDDDDDDDDKVLEEERKE